MSGPSVDLVVPTIGRASLGALLGALAEDGGPLPGRIVVVDDRHVPATPLPIPRADPIASRLRVAASGGCGPAAARNVGWRSCTADWIAFLDDDVVPERGWLAALADDLAKLGDDVAGSQGRIAVPRPSRRPTDWERNVIALEGAPWITADMAYRRRVLVQLAGFDERYRRAFREDTDFALRAVAAGHRLVQGTRRTRHPIRPARWDASLRAQRGNADDVLMRAVHGPRWREVFGNTPARLRRHAIVTSCGALALLSFAMGRPSAGAVAFGLWTAGTGELFLRRVEPGPRTAPEIARMLATSLAIPPLAVWHHLRGRWRVARWRRAGRLRWAGRPPGPWTRLRLVLFDRDGTLIRDVPGARDPRGVEPLPGAHRAVARLREAGVAVAVVTNQHAVGEGAVTPADVARVHDRVDALLGPFGGFFVCPHARGDACECRKPRPGLLREALGAAGVSAAECALVGDIGSDVDAARALGMRAVLVPTPVTRPEEVRAAPELAPDLDTAARRLLRGAP